MSHLADNPFRVLGLTPDATTREVEREAAKLLGMLELGVGEIGTYATPLGARVRTAEAVRAAAAALRDPRRRLCAELWIGGEDASAKTGTDPDPGSGSSSTEVVVGWAGALRAAGWGPR